MATTNQQVRQRIEDAVAFAIHACDRQQRLRDTDVAEIISLVSDKVFNRMVDEMRPVLNDEDLDFVQRRVEQMVKVCLSPPGLGSRFETFDRVVCRIGGERNWAAGTVMKMDVPDPKDLTEQTLLPYVVKIDPPDATLISVPEDKNSYVRAEVCFGQRQRARMFTLCCKPLRQLATRRFAVGDRVACAVEDSTGEYTEWVAGQVVEVNHTIELADGEYTPGGGPAVIPYRVLLDSSDDTHVLVHRDEHWLIRDETLQAPGPRQAADGTRDVKRLVKRRAADGSSWELIDHMTRKLRLQDSDPDGSDDDDDDDE